MCHRHKKKIPGVPSAQPLTQVSQAAHHSVPPLPHLKMCQQLNHQLRQAQQPRVGHQPISKQETYPECATSSARQVETECVIKIILAELNNTKYSVYTCTAVQLSAASLASLEGSLTFENLANILTYPHNSDF